MLQDEVRRKSLSEFLKSRRARIAPEEVGFHTGNRRRTPGLRREEVAQLAGVGLTWYTWLEQGREITVSDEILESIACTLRLDAYETHHLFALAKRHVPVDDRLPAIEWVPGHIYRMVAHQQPYPAFVIGRYWDILAWNQSADLLLGGLDCLPADERNHIWHMFVNPMVRESLINWEQHAQRMIAEFRASYGRYIDDPPFTALVNRLSANSAEFAAWWSDHNVVGRLNVRKEFIHPRVGPLVFEQTTLVVSDAPHLRLVVKIPDAATETESRIQSLLDS